MISSLSIDIKKPKVQIRHTDKLMLIGSCFSEHIGKRLLDAKFRVIENPHGILFNPLSVCHSLQSYIADQAPDEDRFFLLNEVWNHWDFHSRFSEMDADTAKNGMRSSIGTAHEFLKDADWLMITLGSGFQYFLKEGDVAVANCHRAPGQWFEKRLLPIADIENALQGTIGALKKFNPGIKIIFTISPVRHIRDGVVENNRSKARLIEAVHNIMELQEDSYYFPAYELLIDVLRDHRYYDVDMVHPNFAATQVVWEQFFTHFLEPGTQKIATTMQELSTAKNHRVRFTGTEAYARFKANFIEKIRQYEKAYPYIDLQEEKSHFGG